MGFFVCFFVRSDRRDGVFEMPQEQVYLGHSGGAGVVVALHLPRIQDTQRQGNGGGGSSAGTNMEQESNRGGTVQVFQCAGSCQTLLSRCIFHQCLLSYTVEPTTTLVFWYLSF